MLGSETGTGTAADVADYLRDVLHIGLDYEVAHDGPLADHHARCVRSSAGWPRWSRVQSDRVSVQADGIRQFCTDAINLARGLLLRKLNGFRVPRNLTPAPLDQTTRPIKALRKRKREGLARLSRA